MNDKGRYVAILDTGGISYSGQEFVAIASSEALAIQIVARKYLNAHGGHVAKHGTVLRTPTDVADWYGIKVAGPIADDTAVLTEW